MVLKIKDFEFSPFEHDGDSGNKHLATRKSDGKKFIVKHGRYECACNEFLYFSVAKELGLKTLDFHLFEQDESGEIFKSMYAIAIEFVEGRHLNFMQDRKLVKNWQDYFGHHALFAALSEEDSFEHILTAEGNIYRIDTTASFQLNEESIPIKMMQAKLFDVDYIQKEIRYRYEMVKEHYPDDAHLFVETLKGLAYLRVEKIDKFLDAISKLYTPAMRNVYMEYFDTSREAMHRFLLSLDN